MLNDKILILILLAVWFTLQTKKGMTMQMQMDTYWLHYVRVSVSTSHPDKYDVCGWLEVKILLSIHLCPLVVIPLSPRLPYNTAHMYSLPTLKLVVTQTCVWCVCLCLFVCVCVCVRVRVHVCARARDSVWGCIICRYTHKQLKGKHHFICINSDFTMKNTLAN